MTDQKHTENVKYFNYLVGLIKVISDVNENLNPGMQS